ncbi:hypothetical protein ACN47E_009660 [Coniothyrium glycines]
MIGLRNVLLRAPRRVQFHRKPPTRQHATEAPATSQSRIERFNRRMPKFLHRYTNALGSAPLSHMTAFLLLHEITAIIPLFGLAGYFHYTHWLPPWFVEGAWVASGVERFGRYFKRKGWIRSEEAVEAKLEVDAHNQQQVESKKLRKVDKAWNISEGGVRLVVEFATAYAIVKMFLIPRIMFSVWATPWFARITVLPALGRLKRLFGRGKQKSNGAPGAGTRAIEGGAVPKTGAGKTQ